MAIIWRYEKGQFNDCSFFDAIKNIYLSIVRGKGTLSNHIATVKGGKTMVEALRRSRYIQRSIRKLLWIKEHQPIKYKVITFITDSMILGLWCVLSVGAAVAATIYGFCSFDSALVGICLLDLNVLVFHSFFVEPRKKKHTLD